MKYNITLQRIINNVATEPVVTAQTRRITGAENVRDALVEASLSNQRTHNPDGMVLQGPDRAGSVYVVSIYPNGDIVQFIHSIVEK